MPREVRFSGSSIVKPGVYSVINIDALNNLLFGETGVVVAVGEAEAGTPNQPAATDAPAYNVFTDPQTMMDSLVGGRGREAAHLLFTPAKGGQNVGGAPIQGATRVIFIKTNDSARATNTVQSGSLNQIQLQSRIWGTPGNLSSRQFTAGTQSGVILTTRRTTRPSIGTQVSPELGRPTTFTGWAAANTRPATPGTGENRDMWFALQYTGAAATATLEFNIKSGGGGVQSLRTMVDVVGVPTLDLNLDLTAFPNLTSLITFLNSAAGAVSVAGSYRAVLLRADRANVSPLLADGLVAGTNIRQVAAGNPYGAVHGSVYDITDWINNNSAYLTATQLTLTTAPAVGTRYALPSTNATEVFLTGGTLGTTDSDRLNRGLAAARRANAKLVVSLFDADVGALTIDTINTAFSTHATLVNGVRFPGEQQLFVARRTTTRDAAVAEANRMGHEFMAPTAGQEVRRTLADGTEGWLDPYAMACIAAGIRAGTPPGTPLTNKYIDALDVRETSQAFDPSNLADAEALLRGGVLYVELVPGKGFRFVDDVTTSTLNNDAARFGEVVRERMLLRQLLRDNIEDLFIGTKGRGTPTLRSVLERVRQVLIVASTPGADQILIETTDENGRVLAPFRQLRGTLDGSAIFVSVEVTFAQGVRWVLNEVFATPPRATIAA